MLRTERTNLQVSYETLSSEKVQLQNKVIELESEKVATEERGKQCQMHIVALEGHNASLTASLKDAMEQKMDAQPLKEYVLSQRKKIHQLQVCIEEERCKILQIDSRLEEILDTTSYFVDKSQDILEVLT